MESLSRLCIGVFSFKAMTKKSVTVPINKLYSYNCSRRLGGGGWAHNCSGFQMYIVLSELLMSRP